jgi:TM2 domain-containing membrane protein YozV
MLKQGSSGNVIAAIASFFMPGLGQLTQGRLGAAFFHFIVSGLLWFVWLGWVGHVWSSYSAATWRG